MRQETPQEAFERRQRESERYEDRVRFVYNVNDWNSKLKEAGAKLVVVEVGRDRGIYLDRRHTFQVRWWEWK